MAGGVCLKNGNLVCIWCRRWACDGAQADEGDMYVDFACMTTNGLRIVFFVRAVVLLPATFNVLRAEPVFHEVLALLQVNQCIVYLFMLVFHVAA